MTARGLPRKTLRDNELVACVRDGMSIRDAGIGMGMTYSAAYAAVRRHEARTGELLPRRGVGCRKNIEWRNKLAAAYRELGSYAAVARQYGVTRQKAHRLLSGGGAA